MKVNKNNYFLEELALSSARILFKYSEKEEDWTEWRDLARCLRKVIPNIEDSHIKNRILHIVEEFEERLRKRLER